MIFLHRHFCIIGLAALAGIAPAGAAEQSYPTRPIRMVIGFPPGGAADIVARILGQRMAESTKQQVVIDNRPGAGSMIASEIGARAAKDGYTVVMITSSHAASAGLYKKLPFDPYADFTTVALVASASQAFVAHANFPARTVQELIDLAKAKPGGYDFASGGGGSTTHLAGELLNSMAKISLRHLPYKGAAPAMTAVIAGEVPLQFASLPGALPQVKAGRVRALAVTSPKRAPQLPDVPSIGETVPGYEATNWYGVVGPAGIPPAVVEKLNRDLMQALRAPDVSELISRQGADPTGSTPGEFKSYLKSEIEKWTNVIRAAGIKPE
jgi:tripartite-type tricarboxylate transporter receptor subunit TctC